MWLKEIRTLKRIKYRIINIKYEFRRKKKIKIINRIIDE